MNPAAQARLLLADDDPGVRASIGHLSMARGYAVDLAATGLDALAMLGQTS